LKVLAAAATATATATATGTATAYAPFMYVKSFVFFLLVSEHSHIAHTCYVTQDAHFP
jgi:hypothetical protein